MGVVPVVGSGQASWPRDLSGQQMVGELSERGGAWPGLPHGDSGSKRGRAVSCGLMSPAPRESRGPVAVSRPQPVHRPVSGGSGGTGVQAEEGSRVSSPRMEASAVKRSCAHSRRSRNTGRMDSGPEGGVTAGT